MNGKFVTRVFALAGLTITSMLGSGCIVVVASGCDWDRSPAAWTEETVQIPVESAGLTAMEVRSHNGEIEFSGQSAGAPSTVSVRKKAGSSSVEDAKEALAAIEITSERSASGEQKLGWRWKGAQKSRWVAVVSFSIQAPGNLRFDAESHNGAVTANGVIGDTRLVTNNGKVVVDAKGGKLQATTHNGEIVATYGGTNINLETHNGEIRADLRQSGGIRGDITTHNGAIELSVGAGTSANVIAETDNGSVNNQAGIAATSSSRTRLEGKLGAGGEKLELTTHNGSINIKATG